MTDPEIHPGRVLTVWASAACLLALEVGAYTIQGPASWLAARIWALMGIGVLLVGLFEISASILQSLRRTPITTCATLCLLGIATFWGISGTDHVMLHHEATQQVAIGLDASADPDWRYTGTGFLGYPSRQYLIVALPSLVLGRSLAALRLGYALVFAFGAMIFWSGLRRAWAQLPHGKAMASISALALLGFPYLVQHLRHFEQTILPVSLTLAVVGWLLMAYDRPAPRYFIALAWSGAMLGTSYTPGLAPWVLLYGTMVWMASRALSKDRKDQASSWLAATAVVVGFGLLSFTSRTDLLHGEGGALVGSAGPNILKALAVFFLGHPMAFFSPVLYLPMMFFFVLALCGRLRLPSFIIALWSIGVVAAAGALHGYAAPPADLGMHRAIVVAPPLIVACAWWALLRLRLTKVVLQIFFVVLCALVATDLWVFAGRYTPTIRDTVYGDMLNQARKAGIGIDSDVRLVLVDHTGVFENAKDFTDYFFPRAELVISRSDDPTMGHDSRPLIAYVNSRTRKTNQICGRDADIFTVRRPKRTMTFLRFLEGPDP